jgi:hypothetical protein
MRRAAAGVKPFVLPSDEAAHAPRRKVTRRQISPRSGRHRQSLAIELQPEFLRRHVSQIQPQRGEIQ